MLYHIIVFGCQMNISDAERFSAILENMNYKNTSKLDEADLVAVVMCSIRQSAVDRVQGLMQKFEAVRNKNPKLKTILTGCVLKKDKKIFVDSFDYIVDIRNINKLSKIIGIKKINEPKSYLNIIPKYSSKFSATLPIMTGCNNFCSYCVVPYTREREISRPAKNILAEIKKLIKNGYKEIWLLGQNVNSYKDKGITFPALLKMINGIPGNFWIRFTSSHPKDFNGKVIDAMAEGGKITPYLNLPIQSGDNKILKLMNRHYTVSEYKLKIKKLRKKIPHICLSTDIIVGFPGETKKAFNNTLKLFKDVKYDMAYINKYSKRFGTVAAKFENDVTIEEKKEREKILNEALKKTALENNKKYLGKKIVVLIDNKKSDIFYGNDAHYKTVQIKSNKDLMGKFIKVEITGALAWSLRGKTI